MEYIVYCIEIDECGYTDLREEIPKRRLCPDCRSPLLIYNVKDTPSFIQELQLDQSNMDTGSSQTPNDREDQ